MKNEPSKKIAGISNGKSLTADAGVETSTPFVEDPDSLEGQIVELALSGKLAGAARQAIESQIAKGLPVTFMRGNEVVKRYADGREEVLEIIVNPPYQVPAGVKTIQSK